MAGGDNRRGGYLIAIVACLAILAAGLPGTAAGATASWAFEPASVDFGVLVPGETAPEAAHLKLVNTGEVALTPTLITLGSEGEFSLRHNGCQGPLAPGGKCEIEVTFKATRSGPVESTLEVFEANGTVPAAVARLTGAGVSPTVTVDRTTIDFGTIQAGSGSEQERTATITNQGPGELFLAGAEFFTGGAPAGPGPLTWSGSTCGARSSLPPGGSCTVTFRFASLDPTIATGELRITDNALDSPQIVHVSGTAVAPPPLTPAPHPPAAPVATLSGHPAKRTKARTATFAFSGNADTTRFECGLDKGAFRRCTSPARYHSLKPGKHRFWVRPIGTFPTTVLGPAVSYTWRVIGPAKKKGHGRRP